MSPRFRQFRFAGARREGVDQQVKTAVVLTNSAEVAASGNLEAAIEGLANGGHPELAERGGSRKCSGGRGEWVFTAINGTGWAGCKMALEAMLGDRRRVIWFLSEHRLEVGDRLLCATAHLRRQGIKLIASPALRTSDGPLCTSAGTAICVRNHVGAEPWSEWPGWLSWTARSAALQQAVPEAYIRSRITVALVNGLVGKGFLAVAVYLQDGALLGGRNATLLRNLAGVLNGCGMRWVCAGDWNIPPEVLAGSGFLSLVKGRIVAAGTPTCASGGGTEIDYFVISQSFAGDAGSAAVCYSIGTAPHWPVELSIKSSTRAAYVWKVSAPKAFPPRPPCGPRRRAPSFEWAWSAGESPADLGKAWEQFVQHAEDAFCSLLD